MSVSVRPQRQQPTRLPCPWDSPGKNTGVGCHFLLQCMKVKSESEVAQLCLTLRDPMDCSPPGSSVHGIFQAKVLEWCAIAFSVFHIRRIIWNIIQIFLKYISNISQILSIVFFYDPYNSNFRLFKVVSQVSETVLISLYFFFFILHHSSNFKHSIFQLTFLFFLPQLFCNWFLQLHFNFSLLCCSSLIICTLVPLGPC